MDVCNSTCYMGFDLCKFYRTNIKSDVKSAKLFLCRISKSQYGIIIFTYIQILSFHLINNLYKGKSVYGSIFIPSLSTRRVLFHSFSHWPFFLASAKHQKNTIRHLIESCESAYGVGKPGRKQQWLRKTRDEGTKIQLPLDCSGWMVTGATDLFVPGLIENLLFSLGLWDGGH